MCVSIKFSSSLISPWAPETRTITIPEWLTPKNKLLAVRAVLTELGAPQGPRGARCWCGAPVELPLQGDLASQIIGRVNSGA